MSNMAIYFSIVIPLGAILLWLAKRHIKRVEKERRRSVFGRKGFESIKTSTPLQRPFKESRKAAIESVENRFSIIRKLSVISIAIIWILALIFPFLNKIPANFISILVGAFSVIIGIAARTFIENLIAGIVISFSHPLKVGDTVSLDGHYGTVEDITITHTIIKIWNWRRYIIPNSKMLQKDFVNMSLNDRYQWAHVEFRVAYSTDLELVRKLAIQAAQESKHFADYEAPSFWIMEMEERGYKCWVAAWANTASDAWELKNEIRSNLITVFAKKGIKSHMTQLSFTEDLGKPFTQSTSESFGYDEEKKMEESY